jgi:hypothetical protein
MTNTEFVGSVIVAETGRGMFAFKSANALIQWAATCSYKFLYACYQYLEDDVYKSSSEITTMEYTIEEWLRQDRLVNLAFERDGYLDYWHVELVEVLG